MPAPASPRSFITLLFILLFLFVFIQVQAVTLVFSKLGLSPHGAVLLLISSLFGSMVNLPLFSIQTDLPAQKPLTWPIPKIAHFRQQPFTGNTVIAINAGGGLIPVGFSLYLIHIHDLPILTVATSITLIGLISFITSRPVTGMGIGMPILIAPISAAIIALLLDTSQAAPLAYIGGTLGVLFGADLMRLQDIRNMSIPMASIGGAGTFDGIFITGVIAVLLT